MPKAHLMVIAGAGASFDSDLERVPERYTDGRWERIRDPYAAERIPLAKDLFGRRFASIRNRYPRVQSLAAAVMGALGKFTVEEFLGDYRESRAGDPIATAKLMAARYYISDLIKQQEERWYIDRSENNNWMAFLEYFRARGLDIDAQLTFTTTNYDRLIEFALGQVAGREFSHIAHYTRDNLTNVLKLHGSVDWMLVDTRWTRDPAENTTQWIIDNAADIEEPTHYAHENQEFDSHVRRLPAIAIPVKKKTYFTCPESVELRFRERLKRTTHLLVVGWRGEDPHIVEPLQQLTKSLQKIVLVGPNVSELAVLKQKMTLSNLGDDDVVVASMGFSDFVSRSEPLDALLKDLQRTV